MIAQPEALRLAGRLDLWGDQGDLLEAAAELRRLHQSAEDQIGRATAAEAALQMTKATHALKIAAVEAQRDALLEALREYRAAILFAQDKQALMSAIKSADDKARAAIAKAEGEQA